jgi:hypothetical protein
MKSIIALVVISIAFGMAEGPTKNPQESDASNLKLAKKNTSPQMDDERHDIFGQVVPILRKKTPVPLRLPTYIPHVEVGTVYANILSVDKSGYSIELAFTPDCSGANYCHIGTVMGSIDPLVGGQGPRTKIALLGGINGYFLNFTCAGYCDDSTVLWTENGYHYAITMKAEKKAFLVRCANSAIVAKN